MCINKSEGVGMKKKIKIRVGSLVKNKTTGVVGSVVKIIGDPLDPFGYLVKTETGQQRWIIRKRSAEKAKKNEQS